MIDEIIRELFVAEESEPKFESLEQELDAVSAWKRFSSFEFSTRSTEVRELVESATLRGLFSTIVPNHNVDQVYGFSIYVFSQGEEWRINALRKLQAYVLEVGRGWTDDLVRVESMIRGYSPQDTESWIQDNRSRSGFWTGWRRVFVGVGLSNKDMYQIALMRRFPVRLENWWSVTVPHDCRIRSGTALDVGVVVLRTALRQDSLSDEYSVGGTLTFESCAGLRARRTCSDGAKLNALLYSEADILAMTPQL